MNRISNLLSRGFEPRAADILEEELGALHSNCGDEFFVIMNDYKRLLKQVGDPNDTEQDIYNGNELRRKLVQETDISCLTEVNQTSNEYKVLSEVLVIGRMVTRIEEHLQRNQDKYPLIFDMFGKLVNRSGIAVDKYIRSEPNYVQARMSEELKGGLGDYEDFNIQYNEDARLIITVGIRDLTLISIMLCIYLFHDAVDWVFDVYHHMNLAVHHADQLHANELYDSEKNINAANDKIDAGMGVGSINKLIFNKFHTLVHIMGKTYNSRNVTCQFETCQLWYLMKALVMLCLYNGGTDFIDTRLLMDECEQDCALVENGIEGAMSNALMCNIFIFNKAYSWFDFEAYSKYLQYYGGTGRIMGVFIHDREKYNTLYALGILHAIRYANVSLSNPMFANVLTVPIETVKRENLPIVNGACLYKVNDNKIKNKNNFYVIEIQDRILYVSDRKNASNESCDSYLINNQVMNNNQNKVDSCIIYSVLNRNLNNVEYICYGIKELRKILAEYRDGKRGIKANRPHDARVNIDKQIDIMKKEIDQTDTIMKIVGILALVAVVSFYVFAYKHPDNMKYKQSVNDLSLY